MDWYTSLVESIDLRSFSNLWFWIALAVTWSTATHWVLGVPYDILSRARRGNDEAMADLHDLVRIRVTRMLSFSRTAGAWLIGGVSFALTTLAVLGFGYGVELAQALFLLGGPLTLVAFLSLRVALKIETHEPMGQDLCGVLMRTRMLIQLIASLSIFVTALWGMYQNLSIGVLGN
ncbi:component of SufBCD complex [Chachezhania antarctica]|uniref:component of SufBCD complex n=1 Tax=Chachezhania antarctica TaxID=2340860 RepID=UPI000EAEBD29|nr:component of SufBCD complex [Chachezhania antarctica]